MRMPKKRSVVALAIAASTVAAQHSAVAAGFIFASEANGVSLITHVAGYTGQGGNLQITVGIDPTSANAAQMVVPVQNIIRTMNALQPTTGNLQTANVPFSQWDFESVALHEMGHAMGLSHCNLATESGLGGSDREYTKAADGNGNQNSNESGEFDLNAGPDGIQGSADDLRGDDINLNWILKQVNDPAATLPAVIDNSTYGRAVGHLPGNDTFHANGRSTVLAGLGHPNTEAIMQQGSPNGEAQRTMIPEDVGALRMAMAGLDRTQGTADDYTFTLVYAGLTTNADIIVEFDNSQTGFATTFTGGQFLNSNHVGLTTPIQMYFNSSVVPWFFNQVSNEGDPQPDPGDPNNVFVDFTANENGTGAETYPFDNLTDGIAFANSDAMINLDPGSSYETFMGVASISKPVSLVNTNPGGGAVVIGN